MQNILFEFTFLFFLFCVLLFVLVGNLIMLRKNRLEVRLTKFLPQSFIYDDPIDKPSPQNKLSSFIQALGKQFKGVSLTKGWEKKLEDAGLPLKPEEFFVLQILGTLGLLGLAFLSGARGFLLFAALPMGYFLPVFHLKWRKHKRMRLCDSQLPVALGTMANALRSGFSFMQAMQLVGKEMPDPIGTEFARTVREVNLGIPIEEGFQRLVQRLPNQDLELVTTALMIQRNTGGNLAELLDTMEETIKGRVRIKEELNTLTAQGRMSGVIITLMPLVLVIALNTMNPEFFKPMLSHPMGWMLLGLCIVSISIGWFVIRKIIRINV